MTALIQLETIREEAMQRLMLNADYKLVNKLDELIVELKNIEPETVSTSADMTEQAENQIADELENKFETLSNEFCDNVREETNLNGSTAH